MALAEEGERGIELAAEEMPGLAALRRQWAGQQPLQGARIAGSLHVTPQTGVLVRTLQGLGAQVAWCASNAASTDDATAAALARGGAAVFAWAGETEEEYQWCLGRALTATTAPPQPHPR